MVTQAASSEPTGVLKPAKHHLVSRGYQFNFATEEHRIAVLDRSSGRLVDAARAIKSNFVVPDFNTTSLVGVEDRTWLEAAFASVERPVLNMIREVGPTNAGPRQRAAVANLFAVHLVRSRSFRDLHERVVEQVRLETLPNIAAEPEVITRFLAEYGRPPAAGEIEAIAQECFDADERSGRWMAESTTRQHDQIAEMLNRFSMQVVWTDHSLPGFVLADVPVVHANTQTGQYGFRDGLAIGDADLIIGPLTRRVATCFSTTRLPHERLRTRRMVELVNAVLWRAAREEVACHPDDVLSTQQMARRIDRLPAHLLHGAGRRAS